MNMKKLASLWWYLPVRILTRVFLLSSGVWFIFFCFFILFDFFLLNYLWKNRISLYGLILWPCNEFYMKQNCIVHNENSICVVCQFWVSNMSFFYLCYLNYYSHMVENLVFIQTKLFISLINGENRRILVMSKILG